MNILIISTILGGIAAVWFFGEKINSWLHKACKVLPQHFENKWKRRGRKLFQCLSNSAYLEWQQEVLEILYEGLEIATVYGHRYPAAIIRPSLGWKYPFGNLCKLTEVNLPMLQVSKEQKAYVKMLGRSLKWPMMKGFALQRIHIDNEGHGGEIETVTTTFLQNVITTHILEWELYKLYNKNHPNPSDLGEKGILNHLPRRTQYHNNRKGQLAILEPTSAYPLISLQAIVVFYDTKISSNPTWRIVTTRRSDEVVVKPGFFQFQPAGGFEVYGTEKDDDAYLVEQGFNLTAALFREYAEEIFDAKELQVKPDGRDSDSAVFSHPSVRELTTLINNGRASIDYLGIVVDLAVLRHELSFLIVINDKEFCNNPLLGSWEAKNIVAVPPRNLRTFLSKGVLHGSSAALLQLAMESKRLRDIGISRELIQS